MWDDVGYAGVGIESWWLLAPALALFAIVLAVNAARHRPGWTGSHLLTRGAVALYLAGVAHFTLFPIDYALGPRGNQSPWYEQIAPIPLLTADPASFTLNIAMLVPFGVLLPLVSTKVLDMRGVALRALAFSAAIETTQLLIYTIARSGRAVDVNDLLANTLGGLLGYFLLRTLPPLHHLALPTSPLAPAAR
ncbi:VanZ family protein [Umezawaea tangerina]|uniref:Glycopeptide antibiotics resistance protein n=1 Tax=Umezawaea tangerina TaxID=84725 RepID=A0A2T0T282_9PSEU|nr:VanZ family protein [Umezawaea tangerina]PRY39766.1 glycopeptide antibiotics resistance protein [Umezawaea tangerina]